MPYSSREPLSQAEIALQRYEEKQRKRREEREAQVSSAPQQGAPPLPARHAKGPAKKSDSKPTVPTNSRPSASTDSDDIPRVPTHTPKVTDDITARLSGLKAGTKPVDPVSLTLEARLANLNENSYYVRHHGSRAATGSTAQPKQTVYLPPTTNMNVEDEIEALLSEAKDAAEIENRNQERSPSPTYALEMPPEKGDQETLHAKGLWPSIGSKKAKKGQDEVQKLLADVAKAKSELSRAYEDNKDAHHKKSKKNKRMSEKTHAGVDRGDDASDSSDEAEEVARVLKEVEDMKKAGLLDDISDSDSEVSDDDEEIDPWCIICNADATLQCKAGCGLFCAPCFLGTHSAGDPYDSTFGTHKSTPYRIQDYLIGRKGRVTKRKAVRAV